MFRKSSVNVAVAMLLSGVGLAAGTAAMAQQGPASDQRVEVTGSRILSIGATSAAPIQVLSAEDIAKSGVTNIQDLLLKNPVLGTPGISRTNSNFATSSAGIATVDLRDLGSDRTLVLVNGRRFVAGNPGTSAVDLNTIPTDFIERVEILTGGASATYGSDAMAGVVNIILKRNFSGLSLDAQVGESSRSDDRKKKFSVTLGNSSSDGRSSLMAHFGYSKQGAVFSKNRPGNEIDNISTAFLTGDPQDMFKFTAPFLSSYAPQGRVFGASGSFTFDSGGNIVPWSTNGSSTQPARGFNRQEFRTIAIPTERYLFATKGELAFSESHSAFVEGTYAQTSTRTRLEPFPLDSSNIYPDGGQVPAEFLVNGVLRRNPIVSQAIYDQLSDTDGDGARDFFFSRRLSEVGNRGNVANRDTFRILTGVRGSFLKDWDYEVFAGYGSTKESQVSSGQVNVLNFRNALEAIPDDTDINGNGLTSDAICRDANARAQGCVPINVFGFNSISAAALKYVTAPSLLSTFTSQRLAGATVRGEPFTLPAGPVGLAAGLEWREEYSRSEFDPLQQAGLNAGNAIPRTEGEFNVKEAYAEIKVPLLKNAPFARQFALSAAVRSGQYSTVGSTTSWTGGFDWTPIQGLRIRGTTAQSTRAPNINELYEPPSQDFPSVTDPCVGVTASSTGTLSTRCRAAPGVAANIAQNGSFTLTQPDLQGVSGFNRGNPNLDEEVGKSWTLGLVLTPASLKQFSLELDYFKIRIRDAIVRTDRQFILDQCYTGDTKFCQFITRRPANIGPNSAGSLSFVDAGVTNSGGLFTEGVDLVLNYGDKIGPGRLKSRLSYTRLNKGYVIEQPGSDPNPYAGEVGAAKDKLNLALGYSWGPFGVNSQISYIGKSALDNTFLAGFGAAPGSITVPAKTYTDLQLNYTFRKSTFYIGIDNAFDTKPPRFDTNALIDGAVTGTGTASDVYDAIGRRYYVGVRIQM